MPRRGGVALALLLCSLALGVRAEALPIVITDPYGGPNNLGSSNGDVIGLLRDYDIESVTFTALSADAITVEIRFNFHGGDETLANFNFNGGTHPLLGVGDLLFGTGGTFQFGVALVSHDGFDAGDLYAISGTQSSNSYLAGSGLVWNFNTAVTMSPAGSSHLGDGTSVTTNPVGFQLLTTLTFDPDPTFLAALASGLDVQFASAWCGNDVIHGEVEQYVPEPGTASLLAAALAGLVLFRRRA